MCYPHHTLTLLYLPAVTIYLLLPLLQPKEERDVAVEGEVEGEVDEEAIGAVLDTDSEGEEREEEEEGDKGEGEKGKEGEKGEEDEVMKEETSGEKSAAQLDTEVDAFTRTKGADIVSPSHVNALRRQECSAYTSHIRITYLGARVTTILAVAHSSPDASV